MRALLLVILSVLVFPGFAQITGKVLTAENNEAVVGARISASNGVNVLSDAQGNFSIETSSFPVTLITRMNSFITDTTRVDSAGQITIILYQEMQEIGDVVVTASRHRQEVEEVAVSMEIIKPTLIENKGLSDLEQTVNQSPGVFAMDGQVSIRGGGGYSYGAGSRVLVVWNGCPMVSPDVGDVKWNAIPMENTSQIEILKGASSVLYGSGALNGIVALTEREPGVKQEFSARVQSGVYGDPKRSSLKWWTTNPTFHQIDIFSGKMYKRFGYTLALNGFTNDGYRKGEVEDRGRLSGSFFYRSQKYANLKAGVFYSGQYQYMGNFILWENDSLAYIAQGGMDPKGPGSTVNYQRSIRFNIDPYVKFYDRKKNKHELKGRYYQVSTGDLTKIYASAKAQLFFSDYSYQRAIGGKATLFSGASASSNVITSSVFGDHSSLNLAAYTQLEAKLLNMDVTLGMRLEYFRQDEKTPDSEIELGKTTLPVYPVFRGGIHKQIARGTHLRGSFGQGIRFPSVAERFAATSNGGVIIFPNPELQAEKGWAAEVGFKQVLKIDKWKAIIDVAGFINQYSNMIEYTFGIYNPDSVAITVDNFSDWIGFKAKNAERARITGVEFSFNSEGSIGPVKIITLLGYTYMDPVTLNQDSSYLAQFSDPGTNMLKYRFRHLSKADIECVYRRFTLGGSMRYNSYMSNIDGVFESDLDPTSAELFVLPGLKDYRLRNQHGSLVFDLRAGIELTEHWRIMVIVNNILNEEYSSRPADIQAPRNFIVQLKYTL